ncbi:MAG: glycosyltransferase [Nanoarchaeota archaeon]|nr:glycosyltransferase [Nanoarchaeota archaeon]
MKDLKNNSISIVIPAYNEEKRIGKTLEAYSRFFEKLRLKREINYEILIVINNTTDKTEEIVKKYSKINKNIRYLNLIKGGKGYAIIEGFKDALKRKSNLIGFVDADMSTSPASFYDLIKNITQYDGIIGNRWASKSIISRKQSGLRRLASRIFNFLVKSLFLMNYQDTQCGAKIFKREVIERIADKILITQWAFDVNLLYLCKKDNFKIREYPTTWEDKGDSKIRVVKASLKMFFGILRLRIINSPFNDLIRLYDSMPEIMKVNHRITE